MSTKISKIVRDTALVKLKRITMLSKKNIDTTEICFFSGIPQKLLIWEKVLIFFLDSNNLLPLITVMALIANENLWSLMWSYSKERNKIISMLRSWSDFA